jgi:DNA polymerase III subunit epsilon
MIPRRYRSNMATSLDWPSILSAHQKDAKDPLLKKFFDRAITDEDRPLAEVPFVALDFETTGLNPETDDIVSIGAVPFDLSRVYCQQATHWLVNPRQPLDEESVIIHGITHSDLKKAPDLQHILAEVLSALAGKIVVVHYHRIEREFLDRAVSIRLGENIVFPVIDTMVIEASVHRKRCRKFWKLLRSKKQISIRLAHCRERYGLPPYQAHHALSDAMATAELFQAQVAHHYSDRTTLAELWM